MRKRLFPLMFLFVSSISLAVTLEDVPIGVHNSPCWKTRDSVWCLRYEATLDSAVACGLKYFKPGWMGGADTLKADSVTKITSKYSLNQVFVDESKKWSIYL